MPAVAIKVEILFSLQQHQLQGKPALITQKLKKYIFKLLLKFFSLALISLNNASSIVVRRKPFIEKKETIFECTL